MATGRHGVQTNVSGLQPTDEKVHWLELEQSLSAEQEAVQYLSVELLVIVLQKRPQEHSVESEHET